MTLSLSQACQGLIHYKTAAGKSVYTLRNYHTTFAKLQTFLPGDPPLASITREQIVDFLVWLREDYVSEPGGIAPRGSIKLSDKTILNIHADLSALWHWAVDMSFVGVNIIRAIEPPEPHSHIPDPFTRAESEAMIKVCDTKRAWRRIGNEINMGTVADRDRCIVLLLLDAGLRASELCDIRIADVDMAQKRIRIQHGKGDKERFVNFGARTAKALWRYLTPRLPTEPTDWLITVGAADDPRPMTRQVLTQQLKRIGEHAGVKNVYAHRFRHTFAINYLRNGGDLFTLQEFLGHSDLAMVRRYARIAQTDCAKAHQKASPVDNWRL